MNKSFICSILASFYLLFISCSEDEPLQANSYIDPELIGEWYLIDTLTPNIPSTEYSFRGFQINSNRQMISLGIETSTGRVAYLEYPTIDSIIYAKDGKILIKQIWWFGRIDTLNYSIEENKLILGTDYYSETYFKTSLASDFIAPIVSNLSVKLKNSLITNLKVFGYPSAYVSKKNTSSIKLSVCLKSALIYIEINNFNGIGEYIIPYEKGNLTLIYGDALVQCLSDSASTNTFLVDQFDEVNNICSGGFSFDTYDVGNNKFELREGTFIVPIYK